MSANASLDIAIGLVLMYLVLSVVCTSINEMWTTITNARANTLKASLKKIIDSDTLRTAFYNHGLIAGTEQATGKHPSYLSGATFALAILDSLDSKNPLPVDVESIKKLVVEGTSEGSNIRDVLLANIATAQANVETLRKSLATYFDNAMDRVSGVYKRYLKLVSFITGLVLAAALNADSVQVGKALWNDASLRAQLVQDAQSVVDKTTGQCDAAKSEVDDLIKKIKCAETSLRPMPFGWDFGKAGWGVDSWPLKLGGILVTAFALTLGAPFWFDLLSKFMNIRGSGRPPRRTEQ